MSQANNGMHLLVTGANGQLGQCLADELKAQGIFHTLLSRQDAVINDTVVLEKIVADNGVSTSEWRMPIARIVVQLDKGSPQ